MTFNGLWKSLQQVNQDYAWNIELFFKGWYVILLLKILLLGSLFKQVIAFGGMAKATWLPDSMVWPLPKLFILSVLVLAIFLKRNYWLSLLVFIVTIWYYKLAIELVNGGDQVILLFNFIGIFCQKSYQFNGSLLLSTFQKSLTGFCWLLGKIQVALIYLVSGWDKLVSKEWKNGEAIYNLIHVDFYTADWVQNLMSNPGNTVLMVISWMVIAWELLFPGLVWLPRMRYLMLTSGVCFHLFIGFGLKLPDFGLVMVWSYLLFLDNKDLDFLDNWRFGFNKMKKNFLNSVKRI